MPETELKLLIVDNADDARTVREMIESTAGPRFHIETAETLVSALNVLARHSFDVVLMELVLTDSQGLATFETIQRHSHGVPIVIHTGMANEIQALTAVERGAQDYLMKGKPGCQALVRVLQYSVARGHRVAEFGKPENVEAKAIGFLAAKGGVGATTLASHFSVELARQSGAKVLLIDLDLSARSASFLFKTDSRYSVMDAATNLHRLDGDFWGRIVAHTPYGPDLLQGPGAVGPADPLSGERVRHVLRFARALYSFIVVDLGRAGPLLFRLLEEIGEIYLVTTSGMLEMYETSRILQRLASLGFTQNKVRLLLNRVSGPSFVTKSAIEKALGRPACWTLPDTSSELDSAYTSGNFFSQTPALRRQCELLVTRSLGAEENAPVIQPPLWSSAMESLQRLFSSVVGGSRESVKSASGR